MPHILRMKDDESETVYTPRDFEELIEIYMGWDSARYYRNQIERLLESIRDISEYVEDTEVRAEAEEVLEDNGY